VVGALLLVLLLSMILLGGGAQQDETRTINNHLQQAKEAELIANQPGNSEAARRESLKLARERAAQALVLDPDSAEAKRLLAKVETDLDRLDGITRLRDPKLVFDLDAAAGTEGAVQTTGTVTSTGTLSEIVVQSNDAYLLDRTSGQVYRCLISTQACTAVLKSGETVGDRQVGALVAMAQRVGEVVVIDDKFAAYSFNAGDGTWNAQVLGDSSALAQPIDVATYDGHLYLLGAKTGQVVKYASGAYGSPPSDWISDPAGVAQMVDPIALAIDGSVYVLLSDGRVLSMQGGKVTATLAPNPISNAPATDLHTNTDANDLYILYASSGTITRLSKEGQTLAQLKVPEGRLQSMSGMTVVEGKSKIYILEGRKVYEAVLPGRPAQNATGITESVDTSGEVAPAGPPVQAQPTAAP
jgi:hypothetical protein